MRRFRLGRAVGAVAAREDVVVALAERVELALGIEHELLHLAVRLLEDPAQGPALAGTGVRLQQEARLDQAIEVERRALPIDGPAEDAHCATPSGRESARAKSATRFWRKSRGPTTVLCWRLNEGRDPMTQTHDEHLSDGIELPTLLPGVFANPRSEAVSLLRLIIPTICAAILAVVVVGCERDTQLKGSPPSPDLLEKRDAAAGELLSATANVVQRLDGLNADQRKSVAALILLGNAASAYELAGYKLDKSIAAKYYSPVSDIRLPIGPAPAANPFSACVDSQIAYVSALASCDADDVREEECYAAWGPAAEAAACVMRALDSMRGRIQNSFGGFPPGPQPPPMGPQPPPME